MGFIEKPLDDVQEAQPGPEGLYGLVISKATDKLEGDTRKGMLLIIDVVKAPQGINPEEVANVLHNLSFPIPEDDEKKGKAKQLFLKKFCFLFGIDTKGKMSKDFKETDFIGKKASNAKLKRKLYEGKWSNTIDLPQLPEVKK